MHNQSMESKMVQCTRYKTNCLTSNRQSCWPVKPVKHRTSFRWKELCPPLTILGSIFNVLISVMLLVSFSPTVSSVEYTHSSIPYANTNTNKNSGQFFISQLCAGKSQFPVVKRLEGAVLSSSADSDINCTITFRTRSSQQHFVVRFEELKLGCDDHLKMFDGDLDYGQPSIKDFSCRDNLASVPVLKTTGTFLTLRYATDTNTRQGDGFRLVVTAAFDFHMECPRDYATCRSQLCISKSLFCDDINHCVDNSDEIGCSSRGGIGGPSTGSFFTGDLSLSNALGLLIVLVLIIFTCVIIFISTIYCRRESHYAQYQHHLQRTLGVPLQTSSSVMFANHQPHYQYFQPANLSPYITPQHLATTLPRGYSTLPLNLTTRQHAQMQAQILAKGNNIGNNQEYLMMAGLTGPPTAAMQAAPTMQTNLFMPTSQSILATSLRYPPQNGGPGGGVNNSGG